MTEALVQMVYSIRIQQWNAKPRCQKIHSPKGKLLVLWIALYSINPIQNIDRSLSSKTINITDIGFR